MPLHRALTARFGPGPWSDRFEGPGRGRRRASGMPVSGGRVSGRRVSRGRAAQAEVLDRLAPALLPVPDDNLPRDLLSVIRDAVGADTATIVVAEGARLVPWASVGLESELQAGIAARWDVDLIGRVAARRRPRLVSDLRRQPGTEPRLAARGVRALAAVPLVSGDRVTGVLHVGCFRPGRLGPSQLDLLTRLAAPATAALDQAATAQRERDSQAAAREAGQRAVAVLQATVDGVLVVDERGRVRTANPAAGRIFGYHPDQLLGMDVAQLVPTPERPRHAEPVSPFTGEDPRLLGRGRSLVGRRAGGDPVPLELTLSALDVPGRRLTCAIVRDVTERQEYEARLHDLSMQDALTGLGNRILLADRLQHALSRAQRRPGLVAVVICDLDEFRAINDGFGHGAGDRALVEIAGRLREAVRPEDTVARVGGDEFVVVFEQVPDVSRVEVLAERLLAGITRPLRLGDAEVPISASAGVAVSGGLTALPPASLPHATGPGAEELLGDADIAMSLAKTAGGARVVVYEPGMRDRERGRMHLRTQLAGALARHELVVRYQPLVDLVSGRVMGTEALVRWQHPERGLLAPAMFLDLAGDNDLAVEIDAFVMSTACRQIQALSQQAGVALEVWVNLAARTLANEGLGDIVRSATEDAGLEPTRLTLEVTESAMLRDLATTAHVLGQLRSLGIGLAVDDFGTGHTALTYLTRLPVTAVKLDRSFIQAVDRDPVEQAVVSSVAGLSRALNLVCVAEGVETAAQLEVVGASGCDRGQGYLLGVPGTVDQLAERVLVSRP